MCDCQMSRMETAIDNLQEEIKEIKEDSDFYQIMEEIVTLKKEIKRLWDFVENRM